MNTRVRFYAKACLFSAVTGALWSGDSRLEAQIAIKPAGAATAQPSTARPAAKPQSAKPQAAKPQPLPQPSPIIQASGVQPAGAMGAPQPTYQGQSAVQQRLEEMYRKNGREMPPMNLQDMPVEQYNARNVPPGRNVPNAPSGGSPQYAAAPSSKPSLLQRLIPSRFRSSPTPAPAPYQPNPAAQAQSRQGYQPQNAPAPAPVAQPIQPQPVAVQATKPGPLPKTTVAAQPVRQGISPTPLSANAEPMLMNEAEADAVAANEKLDDLNLDKPIAQSQAPAQEEVPAESPFSGLKLSANEAEAAQQVAETSREIPDTPPAVPAPAVATPAAPSIAAAPADNEIPAAPAAEPQPSVVTEDTPEAQDEQSRQLRSLAARRDLKGLKGFCIVALKDKRQLIEAQPEFRSDFGNKSFSFSSSDAKEAFDADPEMYIPAAGGQDVVKQALGSASAEGSLDHAVWYKGKLYLFSSAASRELFIESPAQFATK